MRLTERQLIMSKIVLIDGHSILNRAFFGLPDLTNAEGLHTNAIYGFLNINVQDSGGGKAGVSDRCI
mgnify:CR=1 FL=1